VDHEKEVWNSHISEVLRRRTIRKILRIIRRKIAGMDRETIYYRLNEYRRMEKLFYEK